MQFVNNNDYVTLIENVMSDYSLGIQLGDGTFSTYIGDFQAAPGIGLDNVWNQDVSDRVEGLVSLPTPMPWYHHGNEIFSNSFAPVRSNQSWSPAISPFGNQPGYLNQACYYLDQGTLRSNGYGAIAGDTARYEGTFAEEYLYLRKESAYKFMVSDTGRITMGRDDDEAFQNLYEVLSSSNIGKLDSVMDYCSQKLWSQANSLLESIVDTNSHQTHLKEVLTVLIGAAVEQRSFDGSDTTLLLEKATLHSLEGGIAVKIARASLHLEIEDAGGGNRLGFSKEKEKPIDLQLWPNPTRAFIKINQPDNFNFQIFDTGMRLVKSGTCIGGHIDVSKLMDGYYLLFVTGTKVSFKPIGFCKIR